MPTGPFPRPKDGDRSWRSLQHPYSWGDRLWAPLPACPWGTGAPEEEARLICGFCSKALLVIFQHLLIRCLINNPAQVFQALPTPPLLSNTHAPALILTSLQAHFGYQSSRRALQQEPSGCIQIRDLSSLLASRQGQKCCRLPPLPLPTQHRPGTENSAQNPRSSSILLPSQGCFAPAPR